MAEKGVLSEIIPSPSASASGSKKSKSHHFIGTYEVFLSFRGIDTRDGFSDHLYHNLVDAGVDTFRDDNELRVGEEIGPELIKAIRDSKISIPIFSKKYAESKWCLRELTLMVECRENWGQKIFPIFYDVEPSEVQHYERGSYNGAFVKYENDPSMDQNTVQQWKNALAIVGELKGLELKKETNGREGALMKIVVQKVLSKLKKSYMHLPPTLVGIDKHIERLKGLLDIESNGVRIIGILGMSGLGKTTIAKAIYNELSDFFDSYCFIEDVRGESERGGILNLQKQILVKILNRELPEIRDVDAATNKIKDSIRKKKVFLVLDNVDDRFQIEMLAVNHSWYGAGSRIIITTTNEEVLLAIKVTCEEEDHFEVYRSYKPELMDDENSLKLFSKCAFKRESPPEGYLELAKEVVSNAGGLPLVLETLGSSLYIEKDKVSWEEKLEKLKEIPPKKVFERLRIISYDALDFEQKQIFLDIACFFVGMHKRNPVYMWDACGFHPSEGIRALVRRCLIVVDNNILRMHDRLRELGKQIVKEKIYDPCERSRLWDHSDALETLKKHQGLKKVEILCLNFDDPRLTGQDLGFTYPRLTGQDFAQLPNMRYLSVSFADLVEDFKGLHSRLRWLKWQGSSGNSFPSNLYLKNLVILDLSKSKINGNWKWLSEIKMAEKLKVLNLSHCYYLASVPHLSNFTSLVSLDLRYCRSLRELGGLDQLTSLTYLNLSFCRRISILPDLSKLGNLKTLYAILCIGLVEFQGLEKLESLEVLDLTECHRLRKLPNLSKLQNLTRLVAASCEELIEIQGLENLESLEILDTSYCSVLKSLPDLSNLLKLTSFQTPCCSQLTEIQGLHVSRSLEHFNMSGCSSLKRLPNLSNLKKVRKLEIWGCKVTEIQGLGELESLEFLFVNHNECLERLPDLSNLKKVRELVIVDCKVTEIQGLGELESLEFLIVDYNECLERLPDFSRLIKLRELKIWFCDKLVEIQGLQGLESLEVLSISHCMSIKRVTEFSNLKRLKGLIIGSCEGLIEISDLDGLESLVKCSIYHCESLERLPDLRNIQGLKVLRIDLQHLINGIRGFERLESLEELRIENYRSKGILEVIDLTNFKNLKILVLEGFRELTEIRGLEKMESLEELTILGCESLQNLPDFSNLKNLEFINVSGCKKLNEISGLKSLTALDISGCKSLNYVPHLPYVEIINHDWYYDR